MVVRSVGVLGAFEPQDKPPPGLQGLGSLAILHRSSGPCFGKHTSITFATRWESYKNCNLSGTFVSRVTIWFLLGWLMWAGCLCQRIRFTSLLLTFQVGATHRKFLGLRHRACVVSGWSAGGRAVFRIGMVQLAVKPLKVRVAGL
jgi:hypothetical protein